MYPLSNISNTNLSTTTTTIIPKLTHTPENDLSLMNLFDKYNNYSDWEIFQLLKSHYNNSNDDNTNIQSLFRNLTQLYFNHQNQQNFHSGSITGDIAPLDPTFTKIAAFCFILIIIVSVFCNLTLIYVIVRSRSLHNIMHVFIVNLAISDLITSAGTMPFDVDFMLRGYFDHGLVACGIMHFTFLISLPSSVLNLVLLTSERFVSVVAPFHRIRYLKRRNVIIVLTVTWLYTCIVALFPLVYKEDSITVSMGRCLIQNPISYDIFQIIANFLIPIIYICFANIVLFCVSNKHATRIRSLSVVAAMEPFNSGDSKDSGMSQPVAPMRAKRRSSGRRNSMRTITKNTKAAKRLALLVGVFLFCWLTYIILVATNLSCGVCHPRELTWVGNIINYSSSAINPLLYGLLNAKIRRELKKPFKRFLYKLQSTSNDNSPNSSRRDTNSNILLQMLPSVRTRKHTMVSVVLSEDVN